MKKKICGLLMELYEKHRFLLEEGLLSEKEVFDALDECDLSGKKECVKEWYDGFIFGQHTEIYNPWSILHFLDKGSLACYWANTSSNDLVGKLIREGNAKLKMQFEELLQGNAIVSVIDEQIAYDRLGGSERAVWSLLLASGYLKALSHERYEEISFGEEPKYELTLTSLEVRMMFGRMVRDWFSETEAHYNDFIGAMLADDLDAMNAYMSRMIRDTFSYFDAAKEQIEKKQYAAGLEARGIPVEKIKCYGFAFQGKYVLIG